MGNVSGLVKLGEHCRVHGDHHLLLGTHQGVSLLHLVLDPPLEEVAQHMRAYVHDPTGTNRHMRRSRR